MIERLAKLTGYQRKVLVAQAATAEEYPSPKVINNGEYDEIICGDTTLVGYKCQCGTLIADFDDYSGRDYEVDTCPKCNRHYDE